jgi:hypothetical protein
VPSNPALYQAVFRSDLFDFENAAQ